MMKPFLPAAGRYSRSINLTGAQKASQPASVPAHLRGLQTAHSR
jgi:hypothetical protein